MPTNVMRSPLAGRWFPADAAELRRMIGGLVPVPRPAAVAGVCAVVVPHAGYQYSGKVACQVYARLVPDACERVVILGPTHSISMHGKVSVPDADFLETPLGRVAVDTDFVAALRSSPQVLCDPRAHQHEHSDQIQLPLLQTFLGGRIRVVPIVVGQMDSQSSRRFAGLLRPLLDARTLVVVSSDFTHYGPNYGYVPFARDVPRQIDALDHQVFARLAAIDVAGFHDLLQKTQATVCGANSIAILLELLPKDAQVQEVAYDTSGRMLGDWENSVSYLGAICVADWRAPQPPDRLRVEDTVPLDEEDCCQLLKLARATLEHAVRHGRAPAVEATGVGIRPGMQQTMGGFVTLHLCGQLRGCIGEIEPRRAIWQVVRDRAVSAALEDPRFVPVTSGETPDIRIEISALTPARPVASYRDIVVGKHGMTIAKRGRSAVFLPQVAPEQGWDLATTLTHLSRKAGLPADAWKEGAAFTVFEAQVFHEV